MVVLQLDTLPLLSDPCSVGWANFLLLGCNLRRNHLLQRRLFGSWKVMCPSTIWTKASGPGTASSWDHTEARPRTTTRTWRFKAFTLVRFYSFLQLSFLFILELIFLNWDVVVFTNTGTVLGLGHVKVFRVPPGMPKDVLMQKSTHWNLKAPVAKF